MDAADLLSTLRAAGITVHRRPGGHSLPDRLRLDPAEAIPPDLDALIPGRKLDLLALLDRERFTADPRPDIAEDSASWAALLNRAYALDGGAANGVCGALHGVRCLGARLRGDGPGGFRIDRGDDLTREDYETYRLVYLMPHRDAIRRLIADLNTARAG